MKDSLKSVSEVVMGKPKKKKTKKRWINEVCEKALDQRK